MAMFVNNKSGGGYRRGRRAMSDINVTPMVDVMLVLLVIFMVTAPMLATGVEVNLPQASTPSLPQADNTTITVNVMADGSIVLNNNMDDSTRNADLESLAAQMAAIREANPEGKIFVRGDQSLEYGRVMQVMGTLFQAGYREVALLTDPKTAQAQ